jgi:hypothetical protein
MYERWAVPQSSALFWVGSLKLAGKYFLLLVLPFQKYSLDCSVAAL